MHSDWLIALFACANTICCRGGANTQTWSHLVCNLLSSSLKLTLVCILNLCYTVDVFYFLNHTVSKKIKVLLLLRVFKVTIKQRHSSQAPAVSVEIANVSVIGELKQTQLSWKTI